MMSSLFLYSVILSTGGYPPVAVQVSVVVWVAGRELLSAVNSVNGVSIMRKVLQILLTQLDNKNYYHSTVGAECHF